jgi:hypothetical protein
MIHIDKKNRIFDSYTTCLTALTIHLTGLTEWDDDGYND